MEAYKNEVIKCFGTTDAYKEFESKIKEYSKADFAESAEGLNSIFKKFADCKAEGCDADSDNAQILVKELKSFITNNFYTCTDEILKSLGVMYTADERFKKNIDKHGSDTAEFVSKAIDFYCKGLN